MQTIRPISKWFDRLDNSFRPVPFWAWNGDMRDTEIRRQLCEFRTKGLYELIPLPLYGLEIPFCSDAWWRKIAFTAEECRKLDMRLWLYDEFHCPSGTAGGLVLRRYPWSAARKLYFQTRAVRRAQIIEAPIEGDLMFAGIVDPSGCIRRLTDYAIRPEQGQGTLWQSGPLPAAGTLALITKAVGRGMLASSYGALWSLHEPGYLDVLNPAAVAKFIEIAYAGGERRLGRYFGNIIKGFFTDEPGIYYGANRSQNLPYSDDLFAAFRARFGYEITDRLHELFLNVGACRQTRRDYWSLITERFSLAFNKQIADWCAARGMAFTGHYMCEESLSWSVFLNGDLHAAARWMQVPGIDILGTATSMEPPDPTSLYGHGKYDPRMLNLTTGPLVSTARHQGRTRVLCEAFGVSPWSLTMEDQKKMTDWLTASGVNLVNDNTVLYSLNSFRRMSGGKFFTTGWWRHYRQFSDYCARVAQMTRVGPSRARIAILYPTSAAWAHLDAGTFTSAPTGHSRLDCAQEALYVICDHLVRTHRPHEFIFEPLAASAKVTQGNLLAGAGRYRAVILVDPVLPDAVGAKLRQLIKSGGLVIGITNRHVRGREFRNAIKSRVATIPLPRLASSLTALLAPRVPRFFKISGKNAGQIVASHRGNAGSDVIFLANISAERNPARITVNWKKPLEWWNPATGEKFSANGSKLDYTFEGHESAYLVMTRHPKARHPLTSQFQYVDKTQVMRLNAEFQFETEQPNLALLNTWIRIDKSGAGTAEHWEKDGNWSRWRRVKSATSPRDLTPDDMAYYWLGGEFILRDAPRDILLVVDGEMKKDVFVNGQRVAPAHQTTVWDRSNLGYAIARALQPGRNRIIIRSRPSPYLAERVLRGSRTIKPKDVEPLVLRGRFQAWPGPALALSRESGAIQPRSWVKQGYPHFCGTATYRQTFDLRREPGRLYWLELGNVRDTVDVRLNDQPVATLTWHPFRVEITSRLRDGMNRLELSVSNNFANLLKRYYHGVADDLVAYGLQAAPVIVATKQNGRN